MADPIIYNGEVRGVRYGVGPFKWGCPFALFVQKTPESLEDSGSNIRVTPVINAESGQCEVQEKDTPVPNKAPAHTNRDSSSFWGTQLWREYPRFRALQNLSCFVQQVESANGGRLLLGGFTDSCFNKDLEQRYWIHKALFKAGEDGAENEYMDVYIHHRFYSYNANLSFNTATGFEFSVSLSKVAKWEDSDTEKAANLPYNPGFTQRGLHILDVSSTGKKCLIGVYSASSSSIGRPPMELAQILELTLNVTLGEKVGNGTVMRTVESASIIGESLYYFPNLGPSIAGGEETLQTVSETYTDTVIRSVYDLDQPHNYAITGSTTNDPQDWLGRLIFANGTFRTEDGYSDMVYTCPFSVGAYRITAANWEWETIRYVGAYYATDDEILPVRITEDFSWSMSSAPITISGSGEVRYGSEAVYNYDSDTNVGVITSNVPGATMEGLCTIKVFIGKGVKEKEIQSYVFTSTGSIPAITTTWNWRVQKAWQCWWGSSFAAQLTYALSNYVYSDTPAYTETATTTIVADPPMPAGIPTEFSRVINNPRRNRWLPKDHPCFTTQPPTADSDCFTDCGTEWNHSSCLDLEVQEGFSFPADYPGTGCPSLTNNSKWDLDLLYRVIMIGSGIGPTVTYVDGVYSRHYHVRNYGMPGSGDWIPEPFYPGYFGDTIFGAYDSGYGREGGEPDNGAKWLSVAVDFHGSHKCSSFGYHHGVANRNTLVPRYVTRSKILTPDGEVGEETTHEAGSLSSQLFSPQVLAADRYSTEQLWLTGDNASYNPVQKILAYGSVHPVTWSGRAPLAANTETCWNKEEFVTALDGIEGVSVAKAPEPDEPPAP